MGERGEPGLILPILFAIIASAAPAPAFVATLLKDGRVLFTDDPNYGAIEDSSVSQAGSRMSPSVLFDPSSNRFSYSSAMIYHRYNYAATPLLDGRVLFLGGWADGNTGPMATGERYDPATRRFMPTGSMSSPRMHFTATRLLNGKVLVTGGCSAGMSDLCPPEKILKTAELFDPATNSFEMTDSMPSPRYQHRAILLHDGDVLIFGGHAGCVNRRFLLYHPDTGRFSTPPGNREVWGGADEATLLKDDRVLFTEVGPLLHAEAWLYDPSTGRFSETGIPTVYRTGGSATLLKDGRVLIAGGRGEPVLGAVAEPYLGPNAPVRDHIASPILSPLNTAELYNPDTGRFTPTNPLPVPANWPYMAGLPLLCGSVLLANGQVLFVGNPAPKTAALYDPATGSFRSIDGMIIPGDQASATLLNDGRVLLVGAGKSLCYGAYGNCHSIEQEIGNKAELYDPSAGRFTVIETGFD